MKTKQYLINHPSELNALSAFPFLHKHGLGKITFNASFQHPEKQQLEREINSNYYACGCSEGAKALLMGLLVFGAIAAYGYTQHDWTVGKSLWVLFGGSIALSMLGKLTGLALANARLKKSIRNVKAIWQPDWPQEKTIGCG